MKEDSDTERPAGGDTSKVVVSEGTRPSVVWIFPLVAAMIAIGLGVRSFIEKGISITITFETANGLEAEKTKIKYKDVDVGLVEEVEVSPDASHIIVTASVRRSSSKHLTEATQFWVVRPRIGVGGISGLGTLISGAYIELDPGKGPRTKKLEFTGLEVPPVKPAEAPGIRIVLHAKQLGSVSIGSPIYFRQIRVGAVEGYRLAADSQSVEIDAFVDEPHHALVRETSRFWNMSGFSVSLGADGVSVRSESLAALIGGGIEFETPGDIESARAAERGARFTLYDDHDQIDAERFSENLEYVLYFDGSVRGLSVGAPVDLRGIQVGSVTDVSLEYDGDSKVVRIPVRIEIEPERVHRVGSRVSEAREAVATLVEHGLRAQLRTGNLLTGQLFVELEFHPETPVNLIGGGGSPELPTLPGSVDALLANVSRIVADVSKLPLEKIVGDADDAIEGLNRLIRNLDGEIKPIFADVDRTLKRADDVLNAAQQALANVNDLIGEDSPLTYDIGAALEELAAAARSVRVLSAYLERHPEALLYGKGGSGGS